MSPNKTKDYPLIIENKNITSNILKFKVINNTNSECKIYLDDILIKISEENNTNITADISNIYKGKLNIKIEAGKKFLYETINRNLEDFFGNLKKTLLGKENTYFLVNDRNNEIRQHYDKNYTCNLDIDKFRQSTLSKKRYLNQRDIDYALFIVPDKSVILRDKLPFKTDPPLRNTAQLKDMLYDLSNIVSGDDYYKNDTHVSSRASLKIVSYMISILENSSFEENIEKLENNTHFERVKHLGDLFNHQNWSYNRDNLFYDNKYLEVDKLRLNNAVEKIDINTIPEEFRHISRRKSYYYKNKHSISNKRAIILHDSTTLVLMDALIAYYNEIFFYWDHWFFNDKLIEWFKPDDVLEIRTERFLDNPQYQMINEGYVVKFPISAQLKQFNITNNTIKADIYIKDYRQLPVTCNIQTFIDDKLVSEEKSTKLNYLFNYSLENYSYGEYEIRFEITSKYKKREIIHDFIYEESLEALFKNLKHTFKGLNDTFFIVNDKSNELRQHYDKMYVSNFNKERFITSLTSKKNYLKQNGTNYNLFIIPDKSVVLNKYLTFKNNTPTRHVDNLSEYLIDLKDVIIEEDYLLNDTNVSMCAGLKILSHILSKLHDKTPEEYFTQMSSLLNVNDDKHRGNLFTNKSWSYPDEMDLHDKYYDIDTKSLTPKGEIIDKTFSIPEEYKMFSSTESQYYHNENSVSDSSVLVLCDDSIKPLVPAILSYYKDVFLYQDLWYFNKDLVEWLKPDDILEIRAERTLENAQYQLVSIRNNFVIPITRKVEKCCVDDGILTIKIIYHDLRSVPVSSTCVISVDKKILDKKAINGILDVCYDIDEGRHVVEVLLEASNLTKSNRYKQVVGE